MAKKFLVSLDLHGNELQNAVIQNLASAPAGVEGKVYFDTTKHKFGVYENGAWVYYLTEADFATARAALEAADKANAKAIVAEETRALAAEKALQKAIADLTGDSSSSLADEIKRATAAEAALQDALDAEIKRATAAEAALDEAKADKATTLAGYGITDAYTKDEVDTKLSSVYKYKGTIAKVADLPTEGNTEGDVYNVTETGDNYAWVAATETEEGFWDKLAGVIDLSGYYTKDEIDATVKGVEAEISANAKAIAAEETRATKAEAALQKAIDGLDSGSTKALEAEIKRATAAEEANADAIAAEQKRAEKAEGALQDAIEALIPAQEGNANKVLTTNGSELSWDYATLFKDVTAGTEEGTNKLVINKLTQEEYNALEAAGNVKANELYITTNNKEVYSKEETENLVAAEQKRAEKAEAALQDAVDLAVVKLVAKNPALTPVGGVCTWEVAHTFGEDVEVAVKEVATGEEVFVDVLQGANKVTIKMNAAETVAAETYKVVIFGVVAK